MRLLRLVLAALAFAVAPTLSGCGAKSPAPRAGKREPEQVKAEEVKAEDAPARPPAKGEDKKDQPKAPEAEPSSGGG